jgi:hypothetical protein
VIVKSAVTVSPVLTAGTLSLVDSVVAAAVTNAVTSAASSVITLANCQFLTSALTGVAPVVLNGFYSILNCVYDKPNSTLVALSGTGGTTNSIDYFQYINADKFITQGGTSSQFLKADGSVDSSTYLTGNQTITMSGDVSGSGTTTITNMAIGANKVTSSMLATALNPGGNAAGNLVTIDGTQTLSAKTLTSAKLTSTAGSGPNPVTITSTQTTSGQTITFPEAASGATVAYTASPTFTGTITTGLTTAGIVTTSSSGVLSSAATVSNSYLPLATTSATGIASFDSGDFSVSSGAVTVKAQGIDLAQLTRSSSANTVLIGNGSSADSTYGNVAGSQFATAAANTGVLAYAATGGSTTTPSFRTLVASDIPDASITGGAAGSGVKIAATTITNANISTTANIAPTKLQVAMVQLSPSTAQTVATSSTTNLAWDTVDSYGSYSGIIAGTAGSYSAGTHTSFGRVTATVACIVQVSGGIVWTNSTTGDRHIGFRRYLSNNALQETWATNTYSGAPFAHTIGAVTFNMTAGDYITIVGRQSSGGALGYGAGALNAYARVTVLGVL